MDNDELIKRQMEHLEHTSEIFDKITDLATSSEKRMETTNKMVDKMSDHIYRIADIFNSNIEAVRSERDMLVTANKDLVEHNARLMELISDLQSRIREKDELMRSLLLESIHKAGTSIAFGDVAGSKMQ